MKNNKGITLVALVVTIVVLIILAGISINLVLGDNGIMSIAKNAKENVEYTKSERETELNEIYTKLESSGTGYSGTTYDAIAKITEFKTAIANAIEEAGGVKPDTTAETTVFADSIKGIVKEITKDATATADNISEGVTAWVNGEKITGTGIDSKSLYETGKKDGAKVVLKAMYNSETVKKTYSGISKMTSCNTSSWSNSTSGSISGYIPLTFEEDGSYYLLNTISGLVKANGRSQHSMSSGSGSASITFYTYNSNTGETIQSIGSASKSENASTEWATWGDPNNYSIALFEKSIAEEADEIYYTGSVSGYCCAGTNVVSYAGGTGGGYIDTITATYIKLTI